MLFVRRLPVGFSLGFLSVFCLILSSCVQVGGNVYSVEGEVSSSQGGDTLEGIEVNCTAELWEEEQEVSTVTDSDGTYSCLLSPANSSQEEFPDSLAMEVVFSDTDGADNGGEFEGLTKSVDVERNGTEVLDVQLDPK